MEFASCAHYTEQNKREYEYNTPELLKKIPRISEDHNFSYSNISGPQTFVFGVEFNGTTDTKKFVTTLFLKDMSRRNNARLKLNVGALHKTTMSYCFINRLN